ncbi:MAG: hypothetical protein Q7T29_12120, partial [Gallionella sp.]|nr:hypothetical protein [Gallionella sp.]
AAAYADVLGTAGADEILAGIGVDHGSERRLNGLFVDGHERPLTMTMSGEGIVSGGLSPGKLTPYLSELVGILYQVRLIRHSGQSISRQRAASRRELSGNVGGKELAMREALQSDAYWQRSMLKAYPAD